MINCNPVTHCFIISPSNLFKRQKARISFAFLTKGWKANYCGRATIDVFDVSEHLAHRCYRTIIAVSDKDVYVSGEAKGWAWRGSRWFQQALDEALRKHIRHFTEETKLFGTLLAFQPLPFLFPSPKNTEILWFWNTNVCCQSLYPRLSSPYQDAGQISSVGTKYFASTHRKSPLLLQKLHQLNV